MPNIRELASLADVDPANSWPIDIVAFPTGEQATWATTPVPATSFGWQVDFQQYGIRSVVSRGASRTVRLLRAS